MPCESPLGQVVNRPPTSFSRSGAGMTRRHIIGSAPRRGGAPFARCCRGGSARGRAAGVSASSARRCVSWQPAGLRTHRGSGPRLEGSPARSGRSLHRRRHRVRRGRRLRPSLRVSPGLARAPGGCGRPPTARVITPSLLLSRKNRRGSRCWLNREPHAPPGRRRP